MKRGFALVIALAFFVLAGTLTTILLAFGANAGAEARSGLEMQAARRAAEAAIRIAEENIGQEAARSYYSDPIEAYFWFGGDLPVGGPADGVLANDGEVIGFDYGLDNLPDLLEPRFAINGSDLYALGVAFPQDLDPNGEDLIPGDNNGSPATDGAQTEGNGKLDLPEMNSGKAKLIAKLPGSPLAFVGQEGDTNLGPDKLSSFVETREDPAGPSGQYITRHYHPIGNPDPSGDDYHPVFNRMGTDGKVMVQGVPPAASVEATVENPETRWRRYIHKVGPLAEFNDGKLNGYCSVRALDTSTKVDLNGPSFLTARMIHGLLQTMGTSPGPITSENPSIGYNGRGIEAARPVASWNFVLFPNAATLPPQLAGTALNLLDWPQFPLMANPAFHDLGANLANPLPMPFAGNPTPPVFTPPPYPPPGLTIFTTPRKIASSKAEEDLYFSQPVSDMDPDAVAIVKYRNRALNGRFTSMSQLLDVRRADGSPVFTDRDRDELVRLAAFLTIEAWRDSQTISHRNGDFLMQFSDLNPVDGIEDTFQWDPLAVSYVDPEPWQDLRINGVFEGGERFEDFGFDQVPSSTIVAGADNDESDAVYRKTQAALAVFDPFVNPDPGLDDFHTIWNPFFMRSYVYKAGSYTGLLADRRVPVSTFRFGTMAWSPFIDQWHSQGLTLQHVHYSDAASPVFPGIAKLTFLHPQILFDGGPIFNFDALEGNGILDLDPYQKDPSFLPVSIEPGPEPFPSFPSLAVTYAYPTGSPESVVGVMWSEHWNPFGYNIASPPSYPRNLGNYDFGLDQLNSLYVPGSALMDPKYTPGILNFPPRDEYYYNLSNILAIDPDADNANFNDDFAYPPNMPSFGGIANPLIQVEINHFTMTSHAGTEGNLRFDPYPELGRWVAVGNFGPGRHDLAFPDNLYQSAQTVVLGTSTTEFLRPSFSPLPQALNLDNNAATIERLRPPRWALPDKDWMVEPGEWYSDWGKDRLPNSGDAGEGNGMWDPGETFNDTGIDQNGNANEQAFFDNLATAVAFNPLQDAIATGLPTTGLLPGDYSSDDTRALSGVQQGTEFGGLFDLVREPYLDLNRDGRWNRGVTLRETAFGSGIFSSQPLGAFRDRNGDRLYDRGIYREPRAPININAAPEEVLAAAIYQAILYPAKKRRDRFCVISEDFTGSTATSVVDDYDWATVIYEKNGRFFRPDLNFAQSLSRGLARAIWLRRMGLYNPLNANLVPLIGSGAFRTWPEFESFVTALLTDTGETARFVSGGIHGGDVRNAFGQLLADPFAMTNAQNYPVLGDGVSDLYPNLPFGPAAQKARRLMIERILIQANPNTRLRGTADYKYLNETRFDKTDFPFPAPEFCFGPTGVFEITAVGYAVSGAPPVAGSIAPTATVVGAGFALASEDLLSSYDVRASIEVQKTVKVFSHIRQSSRSDFEAAKPLSRGVAMLPSLAESKNPTNESHVKLTATGVFSEHPRATTPQLQAPFGPFLCLRPDITVVDPVRNLTIVASSFPFDPAVDYTAWQNQPGTPESGGRIQVFDYVQNVNVNFSQEKEKNFPANNGAQFYVEGVATPPYSTTPVQRFRFGMIEPGNGFASTHMVQAPTIRAMAFDPHFPKPATFPDPAAYAGSWYVGADMQLAATVVGGGYAPPLHPNYLGRLYLLDDNNQRLRAIDLGRDEAGGLISQEVSFIGFDVGDFTQVSYGPNQTGLAIELVPERREVYVFVGDPNTGDVFVKRLRYAEGIVYPGADAAGNQALQLVALEAPTLIPGLSILDLRAGDPLSAPFGLPVFVSRDERTGYLYVGGSTVFGDTSQNSRDVLIYRLDPKRSLGAAESLVQIFPWGVGSASPVAAHFLPPGFRNVCKLDTVPLGTGRRRELVGMDIDPGSGVLFALWNWEYPLASPPALGDEHLEQNGRGAYLAAIPLGAASFLTTPLVNPFPMVLSQPQDIYFDLGATYCAPPGVLTAATFPGDPFPVYAASMALDPMTKTIVIAPREQMCQRLGWNGSFPMPPASGPCAAPSPADLAISNPWAREKGRLSVVSYQGDGLRVLDLLNSFELRTDDPLTGPTSSWNSTHPLYLGGSQGGQTYGPSWGRPRPVSLKTIPGTGRFYFSIPAPYAVDMFPPFLPGQPGQCSIPQYGTVYDGYNIPDEPWDETRSIYILEVRGFNFGLGNTPVDHWVDGRLSAQSDAVPLSGFLEANVNEVAPVTGQGAVREPWIHSRANMEDSAYFLTPDYSPIRLDPPTPVSLRPLICQTNARVEGEGLVVDSSIAIKPVDLDPTVAGPEWSDQRVIYPQDGVVRTCKLVGPRPTASGAGEVDVNSGWNTLDTGAEFWLRFGDLQDFLPIAGSYASNEIVIFEKFTKVKAELQQADPTNTATGLNFQNNPFLNFNGVLPAGPTAHNNADIVRRVQNILTADAALGGGFSGAVSSVDYFFPDAIDVWAYDRITMTNVQVGPPVTADFIYERRLAGPAGQYPGIYRPLDLTGNMSPWGSLPALPELITGVGNHWSGIGSNLALVPGASDAFLYPFSASLAPNATLADPIESQKYATVVINGRTSAFRFAPIWSNSVAGGRQASVRVTVPAVELIRDGWLRFAYASRVDFNPDVAASSLMTPSSSLANTRLLVWNDVQSLAPSGAQVIGSGAAGTKTGPDRLSWYQFPGDREGFLAAGSWSLDSGNRLLPTGYPANKPLMGGTVITNASQAALPFVLDDIVVYESPLPVLALTNPHAQRRNIPRFAIGEAGWPTGLSGGENFNHATSNYRDGSTGAFPNQLPLDNALTMNNVGSAYFASEPFFDFIHDGVRNRSSLLSLPLAADFWDRNGNGRWDFGEMPALPGDIDPNLTALPDLVQVPDFTAIAGIPFGEPYQDLNRDGLWNNRGDLLIDLNSNGVMDGEPFVDGNGNWILDSAEIWDFGNDYNQNGIWDGGEPYIDYAPSGPYRARLGEPFVNRNAGAPRPQYDGAPGASQETFYDENRNGRWDVGEPFTSWSRNGSPQQGELYRENTIQAGFQDDGFYVGPGPNVPPVPPPPTLLSPSPTGDVGIFQGFPFYGGVGNTWVSDPQQTPDWNNDGRYEGTGIFEGRVEQSIPAGSRLGAVAFTQWQPSAYQNLSPPPFEIDRRGHISLDLDLRAVDGRSLGRWMGVDNISVDATGTLQFADETGIGLPLPVESIIRYRINFYMPNSRLDLSRSTRPTASPILDDLSFTVVLPLQHQVVFENRVTLPLLIPEYARGLVR